MTTIRDVARHAGVSTTTVSHVVNRTRKVDPAKAGRVEAAIEELGYRPDALAQSMRRGRTNTVGLVISAHSRPMLDVVERMFYPWTLSAGHPPGSCTVHPQCRS